MERTKIPPISIIGLLTLAIIFGGFRYGYGLLLPDFRESFGLSASALGVISSLTFITFLVGALAVIIFISKSGARFMILGGILTASTGLLVAALTNSWPVFAVACLIAGFSPGLTWTSFSESVSENVKQSVQKRTLSFISTGSAIGLVLLSLLYILLSGEWRWTWGGAAVVGYLLFLWAYKSVPYQRREGRKTAIKMEDLRPLFTKASVPFYLASFLFGVTESTYWTYSADFVTENFTVPDANAILFLGAGAGGIAGIWGGDMVSRLGMRKSFIVTIFFYSLSITVLYFSEGWPVVLTSAFVFGASFMLYAAYLPIWSARVFPKIPAQGFSICVIILNVGAIMGPAAFGC
ncbi:MFS transporter [Salimicrobium album]|uniref:Predicted arabinose efflux permease, MFS family n=1 Tax=Salimicrobium album TaxID=50717 RepID=A0A1H3H7K4_9BACI|nr:MFS transporter [Salimicrobium album]SDY11431.1 Predicted arabinose efflux permease, MFS family [Salimicrobium album]